MPSEEMDENLKKLIALCGEMLDLADRGDAERTDAGCGVVYGMLRDSAYKMRRMAKTELQKHGSGNVDNSGSLKQSRSECEKKGPGC